MSDPFQQPDSPEPRNSGDDALSELESKLRSRLTPQAPNEAFLRDLGRRLDRAARDRRENRVVWVRFAPVAAAACVAVAGLFALQSRVTDSMIRRDAAEKSADLVAREAGATSEGPAPVIFDQSPTAIDVPEPSTFLVPTGGGSGTVIPFPSSGAGLVPVSSQGFLREARDGGIVTESEGGNPVREWQLEYEDAWHWVDPETETNIRIFRPREETIRVPVETN